MQFDLFHSIGRVDTVYPTPTDVQVFEQFFKQAELAEELGFDTVWVAESHFSSEVQKSHREPVIPNYMGEVGLNCDSAQLFNQIASRTNRLNFGTAIFNIVGGNGGPLAAADRMRSLLFLNQFLARPRHINLGFAAGRFPYINAPFGIRPRTAHEEKNWEETKRYIFLEAAEIFVRLLLGETLSSEEIRTRTYADGSPYVKRWNFEATKLVPELSAKDLERLTLVLGSHDPLARDLLLEIADVDVFNLSFTPPEAINKVHAQMQDACSKASSRSAWHRGRMPRTVLVFIDESRATAQERASECFETYMEAMRGTVKFPPKEELMARALIGTPDDIRRQLSPEDPRGFHPDDRLMLWFEFNQSDHEAICKQMKLFAHEVLKA